MQPQFTAENARDKPLEYTTNVPRSRRTLPPPIRSSVMRVVLTGQLAFTPFGIDT